MSKAPNILHNPFGAMLAALTLPVVAFVGGVSYVALAEPPATSLAALAPLFPPPVEVDDSIIQAKAAIIYDANTGRILYQKNAREPLPLASLTKLMTAHTVLSLSEPSTPVVLQAENIRTEGDSGLKAGETMTLDELITYGLVASSNDAIAAAAASLGPNYLEQMNSTAARLGLVHTKFYNPTGLDVDKTTAGAYGSAYDVARLTGAFAASHPQFFELTTQRDTVRIAGRELPAPATALPLFDLPGLVGAKTGYTDLAGGNLVAIFDLQIGYPVVIAVLGSTRDGRFEDVRTLITAARDHIDL